jgi:hypothetical protein
LLSTVAASVGGLAILFAALGWLLSIGPISLGFLSPYFEDTLRQSESNYQVEFDDVVLAWAGWKRTLDVRVIGVRVLGRDGAPAAIFPQVSVGLSGQALLRGDVVLNSIEILDVSARLVRRLDGSLDFGLRNESDEVDAEDGAEGDDVGAELVAGLLRPPDPRSPTGSLRRLSILEADIVVIDEPSGTEWRAPRASVVLRRGEEGITGSAEIDLEIGDRLVSLTVEGEYGAAKSAVDLDLHFSDVVPADLARQGEAMAALAPIHVPLGGSVALTLGLDGTLSGVTFDLTGGQGNLDLPEHFDEPLDIQRLLLQGRLDDSLDVVRLESALIDLGGPVVRLSGNASWPKKGLGLAAVGTIENLSVADLKRLWPIGAGSSAREWVRGNILGGLIPEARFNIEFPPGATVGGGLPAEAVSLDFRFQDLTAVYYQPLPPLTGAKGTAHLSVQSLALSVSEAWLADLAVTQGSVRLTGLDQEDQFGEMSLVVTGPTSAMMAVLDLEPLGFARDVGLDPANLGGMSATRMQFHMPLRNDLLTQEIRYSAAANLSDASIPGLFGAYDLSHGALVLTVDGASVHIAGVAALNGAPLEVSWQRVFEPSDGVRSRIGLAGIFDDAQRQALFLPLGEYLQGPVGMKMDIWEDGQRRHRADVQLALDATRMVVPELRWQKPAGVGGSARLAIREADDGFVVDTVTLSAGDVAMEGRISLDREWALRALDLNRLIIGGPEGTDVGLALRPRADGGYDLALQGRRFDLRPYLATSDEAEPEGPGPSLAVSARLGHVVLEDGQALTGVDVTGFHDGLLWQSVKGTGTLVDAGPVEFDLVPGKDRRELTVRAVDAGLVARALGLFGSARGGALELRAVIRDDLAGAPVQGRLTVENFKLVEAPVLASIFSVASLTALGDLLRGDGVSFEQLAVPFTMVDGVVTLTEARAFGPAFGITADGIIDRDKNTADLRGTIAPAYSLNSLPGKIPILGRLLVGREGEGLFAVTYTMKGDLKDPRVIVNPLSALAPGFLRRMFFIGEPGAEGRPRDPDEGPG